MLPLLRHPQRHKQHQTTITSSIYKPPNTFKIHNPRGHKPMDSYIGGLRNYWKSRRRSTSSRRKIPVIQLTDPNRQKSRRRFWHVRVKPKLRILRKVVYTPRWILTKIRDGYVNLMLKLAGAYGIGGGGEMGMLGGPGLQTSVVKEHDDKLVMEIYKNLIKQGRVLSVAGADGHQILTVRR